MSGSDARSIALAAEADARDPEDALRQALSDVARQLAQSGGGPHHLTGMTWRAPDPGTFHPSRRAIDLAYREILGGFRPAVALVCGGDDRLVVEAEARIPNSFPPTPVWQGWSAGDLARQYSPRNQVPDMAALFSGWTRDGAAFRQAHQGLDLAYGRSPAETMDLYRPPGVARPPVWAFAHGGYWQASTKEQHAQFAAGMLRAGFAVANIEYSLAPETDLAGIVAQIRAALQFLVREAPSLGIDGDRLHVAGHSAGGHLAAMAASDPDGPPVRSALLLSGLFQLEPLTHLPVGRLLGLTPENVAALSPLRRAPRPGVRVGVAVGALESEEFKRQSAELANAWSAASLTIAGANHFDLLEGLISGALLDFARVTAGDAAQPAKAPPGVEISRATSRDVEDIVALTDAAQDPDGGGLSQRMPAPLVHRFIEAMPCVVARREGTLVGVLLAQPRPQDDSAGPVTRAMLDAYPGGPDAYVYGPIAVVPEERGRGLAQALAAHLSELTGGREGILFIAAANAVSLKAHRKMGAKEVAGFTWEGRDFLVFSLR